MMEPATDLTVDELAARAGVTVRTIRFYSTRGLLPLPEIGLAGSAATVRTTSRGSPSSKSSSTRA